MSDDEAQAARAAADEKVRQAEEVLRKLRVVTRRSNSNVLAALYLRGVLIEAAENVLANARAEQAAARAAEGEVG